MALELAAARVGVLSMEQITQRLEDSLKLLTGGGRTAMPRQRTLRGTLDWSYELLSGLERKLFCRLSVFAGGWTLEAAEVVGVGDGIEEDLLVLDVLSRLVDKSLVAAEPTPGGEGGVRYRMLEPVRHYARERLEASGEAFAKAQRRHAKYYLAEAEAAEPELTGPEQRRWLDRLEREHDNLRAALAWSLEHGEEEEELGLRLGGALRRWWYVRGHLSEGQRWLEEVLAKNPASVPALRARALEGVGWLAEAQGDYQRTRAAYEESLRLYRMSADKRGVAICLGNLGSVALFVGDHKRATTFLEESLAMLRKYGSEREVACILNDLGALVGASALSREEIARAVSVYEEALALSRKVKDAQVIAVSLNNLGFAKLAYGDRDQAAALIEEGLRLAREVGDMLDVALSLINLGLVALTRGEHERVRELIEESLTLLKEVGDKQRVADCLERMAGVAGARREAKRASRLWGAAQALREVIGAPLPPDERAILEPYLAAARAQLEEASWEAAFAEGQAMSLEEATEYALLAKEPLPSASFVSRPLGDERLSAVLSRREEEVAALVARGLTNRQIASELSISEHTVATHVRKILRKLGLRSRAQLP